MLDERCCPAGCCCAGQPGPQGPAGPQGPIGPQGPMGAAATAENAMRYSTGAQTVAAAAALALPTSVLHTGGAISEAGSSGLTLTPGVYLALFTADCSGEAAGELGAVLALNDAELAYTAARLPAEAGELRRLALQTLLELTAAGTLTVRNQTPNGLVYENAVLTVLRLN